MRRTCPKNISRTGITRNRAAGIGTDTAKVGGEKELRPGSRVGIQFSDEGVGWKRHRSGRGTRVRIGAHCRRRGIKTRLIRIEDGKVSRLAAASKLARPAVEEICCPAEINVAGGMDGNAAPVAIRRNWCAAATACEI